MSEPLATTVPRLQPASERKCIDAFSSTALAGAITFTRTDSPENRPVDAKVRRVCQLGRHSAMKLASSVMK